MYFGYKHAETEPYCLHKLSTFLKCHMPLIIKQVKKNVIC